MPVVDHSTMRVHLHLSFVGSPLPVRGSWRRPDASHGVLPSLSAFPRGALGRGMRPVRPAVRRSTRRHAHMMQQLNIVVIGGGPIGCSAAAALARTDKALSVTVFERDVPKDATAAPGSFAAGSPAGWSADMYAAPAQSVAWDSQKSVAAAVETASSSSPALASFAGTDHSSKSPFANLEYPNMAIMKRGLNALQAIGINPIEQPDEFALAAGAMSHRNGKEPLVRLRKEPSMFCFAKDDLVKVCKANALAAGVSFRYGYSLDSLQLDQNTAKFNRITEAPEEEEVPDETIHYDLLVACDGMNSKVRVELVLQDCLKVTALRESADYKVVRLPPFTLFKNYNEDWTSLNHLWNVWSGALLLAPTHVQREEDPNSAQSKIGPLAAVVIGQTGRGFSLNSASSIRQLFEKHFADVVDAFAAVDKKSSQAAGGEDAMSGAVGSSFASFCEATAAAPLITSPQPIVCSRLSVKNVVLLGDAAHPMSPALGQGMNSGLQDCVMLADALKACDGEVEAALSQYNRERHGDVTAAVLLSTRFARGRLLMQAEAVAAGLLRHNAHKLFPKVVKDSSLFSDIFDTDVSYKTIHDELMTFVWIVRGLIATSCTIVGGSVLLHL